MVIIGIKCTKQKGDVKMNELNKNMRKYQNQSKIIDLLFKYVDKDDKELEGSKLLNKKMSVYYNYIKADKKLLSELNKYYKVYYYISY